MSFLPLNVVMKKILLGDRAFYSPSLGRKVVIVGLDLDCGTTGYVRVWDEKAADHVELDMVDLSCLQELPG